MTPAAIATLALLIIACGMSLLALVMALINLRLWPRSQEEVPKFLSSKVPKCKSAEVQRCSGADQAPLNLGTSELGNFPSACTPAPLHSCTSPSPSPELRNFGTQELPLPCTPAPLHSCTSPSPLLSICIPARNEERNIGAIIASLLAQTHTNIEVLVYDDQSTDATGQIIQTIAATDARVKLVPSMALPPGWNGKQHACWRMSHCAKGEYLLFTDADVRFAPDCLARTLATAHAMNAPLLSGFPFQETHTLAEKLIVPMIFFILLSYLPFSRMRHTNDPNTSAGCGQFLFIRRDTYDASGGHEGFKNSMHDGIRLPRAVRRAGFHTELFDCTDLCSVRMYFGLRSTWAGFAKNAYEGLGNPLLLIFITLIHLTAHVLPWLVLLIPFRDTSTAEITLASLAIIFALTQRAAIHRRIKQPLWPILLHPVAIALMTLIQWHSFLLHVTGKRTWRGRTT